MEHSLQCVYMAVHAYMVKYIIRTLQKCFALILCSSLSEVLLFYKFMALKRSFSNLISYAVTINVVIFTPFLEPPVSKVDS